jgi:nucleotide-binding universal stress UspA family protein
LLKDFSKEAGVYASGGSLMKIERILCPTDLTLDSEAGLVYALALSRAYEAELLVLYCDPTPHADDRVRRKANGAARERIEAALFRHANPTVMVGLRQQAVAVSCDDPGDAITREAAALGADLIVMRSRRRPHRAAILGSTAESVCRTAPCPVLVLHGDEREWIKESSQTIDLKQILVAYDFSDHAELALNYGLSLAQEYQSSLHLLHVMPPFAASQPEISWYPLGTESAYHKAARRLQKAVSGEVHLWCNIKHAVSEGQPYREILNYAERNPIDLICIGAHGAGFGMRALFGSNVDRVLRQAPCPVLVARPLKHAKSIRPKSFRAEIDEMRLVRKVNRAAQSVETTAKSA